MNKINSIFCYSVDLSGEGGGGQVVGFPFPFLGTANTFLNCLSLLFNQQKTQTHRQNKSEPQPHVFCFLRDGWGWAVLEMFRKYGPVPVPYTQMVVK